jgi:hypothetical protein
MRKTRSYLAKMSIELQGKELSGVDAIQKSGLSEPARIQSQGSQSMYQHNYYLYMAMTVTIFDKLTSIGFVMFSISSENFNPTKLLKHLMAQHHAYPA